MPDEEAATTATEKPFSYFRQGDHPGLFHALETGFPGWQADQLHGPAVTGILTRATVRAAAELDPALQLVRGSFDLFAAPRTVDTRVRTEVIRRGRRITLIDAFLEQGERVVARAHVFFSYPGSSPQSKLWLPDVPIHPPAPDVPHDGKRRVHYGAETGWGPEESAPRGARRGLWQREIELVQGELATGFVLAGIAADLTSLTVNSGSSGIRHINVEATTTLVRAPRGDGIGLFATHVSEHAGISAGSAVVFDAFGPIGVSTVSAIEHAAPVG